MQGLIICGFLLTAICQEPDVYYGRPQVAVSVPVQVINDARSGAGELWKVVIALSFYESNWQPGAVGDNGCSIGYLQMNRCGGLGQGYTVDELKNGERNFELGANHIRRELAQGKSLYDALWPWTVRPQAWELYQRILREGITGVSNGHNGNGDGNGGGNGNGQQQASGLLPALIVFAILLAVT